MSSQRSRILYLFAGGCVAAAVLSGLTIALAPDSMLPFAMRWAPVAIFSLLGLAGLLARVASWQPASSPPPAAARRQVLAQTAAPHPQYRNGRPARAVRAGQLRNELPAGGRPVRAALPAAPERVI